MQTRRPALAQLADVLDLRQQVAPGAGLQAFFRRPPRGYGRSRPSSATGCPILPISSRYYRSSRRIAWPEPRTLLPAIHRILGNPILPTGSDVCFLSLDLAQGSENLPLAAPIDGYPRGLVSTASEPREGQDLNCSLGQLSGCGSGGNNRPYSVENTKCDASRTTTLEGPSSEWVKPVGDPTNY